MKKKKRQRGSPPAEWLAPVDPEQFKFCFTMMGAASSGAMVTPRPRPLLIEGFGELSLRNTPFNRGMLAVSKHLRDDYPHSAGDEMPSQIHAIMFRLTALGDFPCDCFKGKHPHSEQFILPQKEGADIHGALIEAGAIAKIDRKKGFSADSILGTANSIMANGLTGSSRKFQSQD
jgi:hypothetical protein